MILNNSLIPSLYHMFWRWEFLETARNFSPLALVLLGFGCKSEQRDNWWNILHNYSLLPMIFEWSDECIYAKTFFYAKNNFFQFEWTVSVRTKFFIYVIHRFYLHSLITGHSIRIMGKRKKSVEIDSSHELLTSAGDTLLNTFSIIQINQSLDFNFLNRAYL